jgi:hypothetical protein
VTTVAAFLLPAALVLVLPGVLVILAAGRHTNWVMPLAAAPAASYGVVMTVGLALNTVRAPVRWWTVLPIAVLLPAAWLILRHRRDGWALPPVDLRRGLAAARRPDVLVVVLAVLVAALGWLLFMHFGWKVPPNDDGTHHGLFTARIGRLGSLDISRVAVGDVQTNHPAFIYYPLGLHLAAALTGSLAHISVAAVLDLTLVTIATVVLPVGVYVLTRRLFPAQRAAASAAAVLALVFPAFPYAPIRWGGITIIAGMALVPAVTALALDLAAESSWSAGVALGFAGVGIFEVHNSEIVTLLILAGAGAAIRLARGPAGRRALVATHFRPYAAATAVLLVVAVPQLPTFARDATTRVDVSLLKPEGVARAARDAVDTFVGGRSWGAALLTVFVLIGAAVAARRYKQYGWLAAAAFFVLLPFFSAQRFLFADALSIPWYKRWDRSVLNQIYFVSTLGGLGLVVLAEAVAQRWRAVGRYRSVAIAAVVPVVVAALALPSLIPQDHAALVRAWDKGSLVGGPQRAGFAWLARHVRPGDRVLNDVSDDSGWMYALDGVHPLFAMTVHAFPKEEWGWRYRLLRRPGSVLRNPRLRATADTWHVNWAYFSPTLFMSCSNNFVCRPRRAGLSARGFRTKAWRLVWHEDGVLIFKRVRHGVTPTAR